MTIAELRAALGARGLVFRSGALPRVLGRPGLPRQQSPAPLAVPDRPAVRNQRPAWRARQPGLAPARWVFLAEPWATAPRARPPGGAPRGARLRRAVPHGHGHTHLRRRPHPARQDRPLRAARRRVHLPAPSAPPGGRAGREGGIQAGAGLPRATGRAGAKVRRVGDMHCRTGAPPVRMRRAGTGMPPTCIAEAGVKRHEARIPHRD